MKLYIALNEAPLAGFINIDIAKHAIDLANLDNICEASECNTIILNDVLKFVSFNSLGSVVKYIVSKLRLGGSATFIFTDLNSIVREFYAGNISIDQFNELVFGPGARCCFTTKNILDLLSQCNVNVNSVDVSKEQVVVKFERV